MTEKRGNGIRLVAQDGRFYLVARGSGSTVRVEMSPHHARRIAAQILILTEAHSDVASVRTEIGDRLRAHVTALKGSVVKTKNREHEK